MVYYGQLGTMSTMGWVAMTLSIIILFWLVGFLLKTRFKQDSIWNGYRCAIQKHYYNQNVNQVIFQDRLINPEIIDTYARNINCLLKLTFEREMIRDGIYYLGFSYACRPIQYQDTSPEKMRKYISQSIRQYYRNQGIAVEGVVIQQFTDSTLIVGVAINPLGEQNIADIIRHQQQG